MKNFFIFLILFFSNIIIFAQNNDLPERSAFTLKLAVNDTNYYQAEIKAVPYVLPDNTIQIYPGENLYIEAEISKKHIISLKSVKENLNPKKTIVISFKQVTDGKNHSMMILDVENPFNKKLEYKAFILLMKINKWVPTTIIPVRPQIRGIETWPDIIISIALSEWKLK